MCLISAPSCKDSELYIQDLSQPGGSPVNVSPKTPSQPNLIISFQKSIAYDASFSMGPHQMEERQDYPITSSLSNNLLSSSFNLPS